MNDPFPDEIDETLWDEACRRADAIRSFLKSKTGSTTAADVAKLAAELGLSQAIGEHGPSRVCRTCFTSTTVRISAAGLPRGDAKTLASQLNGGRRASRASVAIPRACCATGMIGSTRAGSDQKTLDCVSQPNSNHRPHFDRWKADGLRYLEGGTASGDRFAATVRPYLSVCGSLFLTANVRS